ncbi:uncharacterized protein LTR77_001571 [Saxophila tyrrhenica]|uniref:F-box domain-containing protein n=1 Tax=Saxophila tyrrhenica TaxID=1690608 RepID=A0AAV9PNX7_9PEZI|nr:hypothetical protein LTR77_001571 [Saxophila tyrrhenica]
MAGDSGDTAIMTTTRNASESADADQSTPQQAVFDLPELLEMVLELLDPLEIAKAAAINRTAKDLVRRSPALHQAMDSKPQTNSAFRIPCLGRSQQDYTCVEDLRFAVGAEDEDRGSCDVTVSIKIDAD